MSKGAPQCLQSLGAGRPLCPADFCCQLCRRVTIDEGEGPDATASGANQIRADDSARSPVTALDQHVGLQESDEIVRGVLGEYRHIIDHFQCGDDLAPIARRYQRASGPFQPSYRGIAVESDNERVTQSPGGTQIADVPGVQQIEAAIGEYDPAAALLKLPQLGGERPWRANLRPPCFSCRAHLALMSAEAGCDQEGVGAVRHWSCSRGGSRRQAC